MSRDYIQDNAHGIVPHVVHVFELLCTHIGCLAAHNARFRFHQFAVCRKQVLDVQRLGSRCHHLTVSCVMKIAMKSQIVGAESDCINLICHNSVVYGG